MKLQTLSIALSAVLLISVVEVDAGFITSYTGQNFTLVVGSAPTVTTSDKITGFVEFSTAPLPNETGKTDWIAFSLSDGSRTLSLANSDEFATDSFFDFNAFGGIVDWKLDLMPDGEAHNANVMKTTPTSDRSRLDAGSIQTAQNDGGGSWTPISTPVPEPSTLVMLLTGSLGLVAYRVRWKRNQG